MDDLLLKYGNQPTTRGLIKAIGLPTPPKLKRGEGPWKSNQLAAKKIYAVNAENAKADVSKILSDLGVEQMKKAPSDEEKAHALVFDATGIRDADELDSVYEFFHNHIRKLHICGRIVVIGQNADEVKEREEQVAQQALVGIVKSLAKETGRKGITAQLVTLSHELIVKPEEIPARLEPVLHFLLSERSAFISAQVIPVSAELTVPAEVLLQQPLHGKTALVTGAARGIGEATAERLAEEGATVIVLDRPEDTEAGQKVAEKINGKFFPLDISASDAPQKLKSYLDKEFGGVDIIVHNAGVTRDRTIAKMNKEWWDLVMEVNLKAVIRVTKELLPDTLNDNGRIICLSSISGIAGNVGQTNYCATKAGVIGFCRSLAEELKNRGITANAVAPGFIETRMTASMPFFTREAGRRLSCLGQGGLPVDIAEGITFLASPGAFGITGQTLRVCGGSYIGA